MKKFFITVSMAILCGLTAIAQSPNKLSYQAVARDNNGNTMANSAVSFRISILQGSASGASVYTETHNATTNNFGLANLAIGGGSVVSGDMSTIDWANGPYFVSVEFDAAGGSNYVAMGTSELLSVPYALYAANAPAGSKGPAGP